MARRKTHTQTGHVKPASAWVWMLVGVVLGFTLFTLSFVFITDRDKKLAMQALEEKMASIKKPLQSMTGSGDDDDTEVEYKFYDLLTKDESGMEGSPPPPVPDISAAESRQPVLTLKQRSNRGENQITSAGADQSSPAATAGQSAASSPAAASRPSSLAGDKKAAAKRAGKNQSQQLAKRTPTPELSPARDKTETSGAGYFLQAGAFRRLQQADRMKANLTLMGLPCYIQTAKVKNHTYHRVRLGPFDSPADRAQAKAKLQAQNIPAIPVN